MYRVEYGGGGSEALPLPNSTSINYKIILV